jgi:hypothetical protein
MFHAHTGAKVVYVNVWENIPTINSTGTQAASFPWELLAHCVLCLSGWVCVSLFPWEQLTQGLPHPMQ